MALLDKSVRFSGSFLMVLRFPKIKDASNASPIKTISMRVFELLNEMSHYGSAPRGWSRLKVLLLFFIIYVLHIDRESDRPTF